MTDAKTSRADFWNGTTTILAVVGIIVGATGAYFTYLQWRDRADSSSINGQMVSITQNNIDAPTAPAKNDSKALSAGTETPTDTAPAAIDSVPPAEGCERESIVEGGLEFTEFPGCPSRGKVEITSRLVYSELPLPE